MTNGSPNRSAAGKKNRGTVEDGGDSVKRRESLPPSLSSSFLSPMRIGERGGGEGAILPRSCTFLTGGRRRHFKTTIRQTVCKTFLRKGNQGFVAFFIILFDRGIIKFSNSSISCANDSSSSSSFLHSAQNLDMKRNARHLQLE